MKDWLESLEQRERWFVLGGAVIVAFALLFGLVWAPLDRGYQSRLESVDQWSQSVRNLAPLKARIASGAPTTTSTRRSNQTPVLVIDQTLRSRGLDQSLRRSQPVSSTGIRVEFENVAFDELVLWLGDLSREHSLDVQAGSFSKPPRAAPGRVNATLTLERSL